MSEVREISDTLGDAARIRFMRLDSPGGAMIADAAVSLQRLVAKGT